MSIVITNITDEKSTKNGLDEYMLRINGKAICKFEHERVIGGLAQCLRDAANKVDDVREKEKMESLRHLAELCN